MLLALQLLLAQGLPSQPAWIALLGGAAVLAAAVMILTYAIVAQRRRLSQEARDLVQVVEELRGGKTRRRADVAATSPLGVLADSVHRLGHELQSRWNEAESAAERWRALIDASEEIAVITTDTDGDIRSFSAGATSLFGWDEDEVLARPAAVVFDENSYKDLLPKLARRTLRKHGVTTRSTLLKRDSSSFPAEVGVRLLTGSASQPVGFMMVVRDITQQLQMEAELRSSEERYRSLVEGLGEGVLIIQQGCVAYANPAAAVLTERAPAELSGMRWRDLVVTGDVLVSGEALASLQGRKGAVEQIRCTLLGREGSPRADVRILASAMDYAGEPAVLFLVQDESAERRMQNALHRNETRLDAVLEATSDGIVVIADRSEGDVVQMTNRAFAELIGLRVDEFLGQPERVLLEKLRRRGEGVSRVAEAITAAADEPTRISITREGEAGREIVITVATLVGRDGGDLGRIVACRDVTEQRRSERQLQEQAEKLQLGKLELEQSYRDLNDVNRELESRGEQLDSLNQELRRLDEMKSDLLGNVSHELQTPLVSIRGYTEMILKERLGPITEEQRKGLQLSLKNTDRLISMIDNLLQFTRTDPGDEPMQLARFMLRPLIDEAVQLLREKIDARRIEVSISSRGDRLEVQADRDKVLQVFLNLLSNAVKFNRDEGRIEITALAGRSGYATVRVRDNGSGIPPEAVGRVFDRHFQAPRQDGRTEGSGIGLAIVRDILRKHGCTIQVESQIGRGAEFTFTLPMPREAEATPEPVEEAPPPEATPERPSGPAGPARLRIIRRRDGS